MIDGILVVVHCSFSSTFSFLNWDGGQVGRKREREKEEKSFGTLFLLGLCLEWVDGWVGWNV